MHKKRGDLNRDRRVARLGGWLDRVAKTLWGSNLIGAKSIYPFGWQGSTIVREHQN